MAEVGGKEPEAEVAPSAGGSPKLAPAVPALGESVVPELASSPDIQTLEMAVANFGLGPDTASRSSPKPLVAAATCSEHVVPADSGTLVHEDTVVTPEPPVKLTFSCIPRPQAEHASKYVVPPVVLQIVPDTITTSIKHQELASCATLKPQSERSTECIVPAFDSTAPQTVPEAIITSKPQQKSGATGIAKLCPLPVATVSYSPVAIPVTSCSSVPQSVPPVAARASRKSAVAVTEQRVPVIPTLQMAKAAALLRSDARSDANTGCSPKPQAGKAVSSCASVTQAELAAVLKESAVVITSPSEQRVPACGTVNASAKLSARWKPVASLRRPAAAMRPSSAAVQRSATSSQTLAETLQKPLAALQQQSAASQKSPVASAKPLATLQNPVEATATASTTVQTIPKNRGATATEQPAKPPAGCCKGSKISWPSVRAVSHAARSQGPEWPLEDTLQSIMQLEGMLGELQLKGPQFRDDVLYIIKEVEKLRMLVKKEENLVEAIQKKREMVKKVRSLKKRIHKIMRKYMKNSQNLDAKLP